MAADKIVVRVFSPEGVSEWTLRHTLSVEKVRYSSDEVRGRHNVVASRVTSRDAERTWFFGITVLDRAGMETDAPEGERNTER